MDYIRNENETAPLIEALFQLDQIYRLLDKRSELNLVSRMTVGNICNILSYVAVVFNCLSLFYLRTMYLVLKVV